VHRPAASKKLLSNCAWNKMLCDNCWQCDCSAHYDRRMLAPTSQSSSQQAKAVCSTTFSFFPFFSFLKVKSRKILLREEKIHLFLAKSSAFYYMFIDSQGSRGLRLECTPKSLLHRLMYQKEGEKALNGE
jgi:hypothetical protein